MKIIITIILALIVLAGCAEKPAMKRPFVIIDKEVYNSNGNVANYTYQDANGLLEDFSDNRSIYHIGDTIK